MIALQTSAYTTEKNGSPADWYVQENSQACMCEKNSIIPAFIMA